MRNRLQTVLLALFRRGQLALSTASLQRVQRDRLAQKKTRVTIGVTEAMETHNPYGDSGRWLYGNSTRSWPFPLAWRARVLSTRLNWVSSVRLRKMLWVPGLAESSGRSRTPTPGCSSWTERYKFTGRLAGDRAGHRTLRLAYL